MNLPTILFGIIATFTAGSAIGVIVSRGIIRAAVFLLMTLIGVSLCYFLIGAEFLGAAQLMIYVGGTLVLVVFGGMLTAGGPFHSFPVVRKEWILGGLASIGLFALLVSVSLDLGSKMNHPAKPLPGIGQFGLGFLGVPEKVNGPTYLLPFEIVSIHLLVVLIGAAYLARAKKKPAGDAR